jgi:hypothetical protein
MVESISPLNVGIIAVHRRVAEGAELTEESAEAAPKRLNNLQALCASRENFDGASGKEEEN